jgi:hypothetical protein
LSASIQIYQFLRYIDIPQNESVDITMTPIGTFELFLRLEQAYTYEVRICKSRLRLAANAVGQDFLHLY